ncbi:MAG TPA: hypothetical protein VMS12_03935, partial [Thermoanaerobaculia bacterium]|nr:hypothetical protein [Thermoanaerobaculia bacterium]
MRPAAGILLTAMMACAVSVLGADARGTAMAPSERRCTLTLQTCGSGSVSGAPLGESSYDCNTTTISLRAEPATGSSFAGWTGSITSAGSSLGFVLGANKDLTANFQQDADSPDPGTVLEPDCTDSPILLNMGKGSSELSGDKPAWKWTT